MGDIVGRYGKMYIKYYYKGQKHFSICILSRIMYGFFAKMTPINRHGLLSLALSVFDGPQEKTGVTLYLQARRVAVQEHKLLSKQNDFALKSNYRVSKG